MLNIPCYTFTEELPNIKVVPLLKHIIGGMYKNKIQV